MSSERKSKKSGKKNDEGDEVEIRKAISKILSEVEETIGRINVRLDAIENSFESTTNDLQEQDNFLHRSALQFQRRGCAFSEVGYNQDRRVATNPHSNEEEYFHPFALWLFGPPPHLLGRPDLGLRKETPQERRGRLRRR